MINHVNNLTIICNLLINTISGSYQNVSKSVEISSEEDFSFPGSATSNFCNSKFLISKAREMEFSKFKITFIKMVFFRSFSSVTQTKTTITSPGYDINIIQTTEVNINQQEEDKEEELCKKDKFKF